MYIPLSWTVNIR